MIYPRNQKGFTRLEVQTAFELDNVRVCFEKKNNRHVVNKHKPLTGFTLIETLVAVTVLAVSIVGPFYAVQSAITASASARDQLIASSLAQEGIEYIRSIRDNNYLAGRSWLSGLDECRPGPCVVDPTQSVPGDIRSSVAPLYLSANNIYNQQQSGTPTRFTRTVAITTVSATEIIITVTVSWTGHMTRSVTVVDRLHDWL